MNNKTIFKNRLVLAASLFIIIISLLGSFYLIINNKYIKALFCLIPFVIGLGMFFDPKYYILSKKDIKEIKKTEDLQ